VGGVVAERAPAAWRRVTIRVGIPLCITCACLIATTGGARAAGWSIEKIALEGDPGPPRGGSYTTFYSGVSLNDAGDVGFGASVDAPSPSQVVVVVRAAGTVDEVRQGDPGPVGTSGDLGTLGAPWLNDAGEFVFGAFQGDPLYRYIWVKHSGSALELVAAQDDPVPGLVDTVYDTNPEEVRIDDLGNILLSTGHRLIPSGSSSSGVIVLGQSGHTHVALQGQPAPVPGSPNFSAVSSDLDFDGQGDAALYAELEGFGPRGMYAWIGGVLSNLALDGDPDPGGSTGTLSFGSVHVPSINSLGEVVFMAFLNDPSANPPSFDSAILRYGGGTLSRVARAGDAVPGLEAHVFYDILHPKINDRGEVFFNAQAVDGAASDLSGLFALKGGALETLLLEGDILPGSGGVPLLGVDFRSLAANDLGQVAVRIVLVDGRQGIYLLTPSVSAVPSLSPHAATLLVTILVCTAAFAKRRVATRTR